MNRRLLLPLFLLFASSMAYSQGGNTLIIRFAGAPSGPCSPFMLGINNATGAQYDCLSGAWNLVGGGGGGGTVTSVSFTGGLISVANPTTTPAFTVAGTSGGIPFFDSASTWNTSALLASGGVVLGGGAGTTPATNTRLTFATGTLTVGLAGTTGGVLNLAGSTSGGATFTAPAIAGTVTNPVAMSNNLSGPDGSASAPTYARTTGGNTGIYFNGTSVEIASNGTAAFRFAGGPFQVIPSNGTIQWTASTADAGGDTGLSRDAAAVVDVGNGNAGSTTGKMKAAGYMSAGTKFTTDTGCGTVTTLVGGATAGSFVANTTGACTVVITMGDSATAPNGWICSPSDRTTGNLFRQSASSTTTCTVTGTAVSGDVISFAAIGY